jgi:hypothetical protein
MLTPGFDTFVSYMLNGFDKLLNIGNAAGDLAVLFCWLDFWLDF